MGKKTMSKFDRIVLGIFLLLLFLGGMSILVKSCFAGQEKYTVGGQAFAVSEEVLTLATCLTGHGRWRQLESMRSLGLVKFPSSGILVEVYSVRGHVYRVRFRGSQVIWWTTKRALRNRQYE